MNSGVLPQPGSTDVLVEMAKLREFAGPPAEFWRTFLETCARLAGAARALLVVRDPEREDAWKKLAEWTGEGHAPASSQSFLRAVPALAARGAGEESLLVELEPGPTPGTKAVALVVKIPTAAATAPCAALFLLAAAIPSDAREALTRLRLCADAPAAYRRQQELAQARADVEKLACVLDALTPFHGEARFRAAALALCNAVATRFRCDRASLGWQEGAYLRLKTISRMERFEKKMSVVRAIETVMEECLDQDNEILCPPPGDSAVVSRDHERYAREHAAGHLCSIPLRVKNRTVAVLTCERAATAFPPLEIQQLRLLCDQAAPRLAELHTRDRWFGARWAGGLRRALAGILGPEHTWAKVGTAAAAAALLLLCLPIYPYRVEGRFIVRSDEVAFITAPYDGYIRESELRPGDLVRHEAPLLRLDTADLELEEAAAIAEWTRHSREVEKARAEAERPGGARQATLADMRISQALIEQATARLDLVRHRLRQAAPAAPFDAVVLEGDLRQRIGSHVKQGDPLFKIARLDKLYVETEIAERDVHEILGRDRAEVAFVTQPRLAFPVRLTQLEPAANPKDGQNVFLARGEFDGPRMDWWRPGMSGICKIPIEKRTLLWILTHRTVDFLRMWLWW